VSVREGKNCLKFPQGKKKSGVFMGKGSRKKKKKDIHRFLGGVRNQEEKMGMGYGKRGTIPT